MSTSHRAAAAPDESAGESPAGDATAGDAAAPDEPTGEATAPDEPADEPAGDGAAGVARPHRWGRRVGRASVVVVVLLVALAGWLSFRVYQAGTALRDARDGLPALDGGLDGDAIDELDAALPAVQADLHRAASASNDPVWTAATVVPWLGDHLRAVRTVAVGLDDVVGAAVPALAGFEDAMAAQHDAPEGAVALEPFEDAAPLMADAQRVVDERAAQIAALDTDGLVGPVRSAVVTLQDQMPTLASAVQVAARASRVLPPMLGADGSRTYLVVALNPAELRAGGGIASAFTVLTVVNGAPSIGESYSTRDLPRLDDPVLPLTSDEEAVFGEKLGTYVQDAVLTPDFPRAAQLLAARWATATGRHVDGVVAADPQGLAAVLSATGPLTGPYGVELNEDDVVDVLTRQVYIELADESAIDEFVNGVVGVVFGAVSGSGTDRVALALALGDAASQGHVQVWSAHEEEQADLVGTSLGGFLTGDVPDAAGVFLDDTTAGKLGAYLSVGVEVEDLRCEGPDPSATVRIVLTYDPPADLADLPEFVTGTADTGLPLGTLATNVSVYAPVGAPLHALQTDDGWVGGQQGSIAGRQVQTVTAVLAPGGTTTYRVEMPVRDGALTVWSAPTATPAARQTIGCG